MRNPLALTIAGVAVVLWGMVVQKVTFAADAPASNLSSGKEIAFDRKLGNCLACHAIAGGSTPGDLGPALAGMQKRFPDKAKLRALIADSKRFNPDTRMPPFGTHKILSDKEIDQVVEFLYSL